MEVKLALLEFGPASLTLNYLDSWSEQAACQVKLARRAGGILHTVGLHDRVTAVRAATILSRLAELLHLSVLSSPQRRLAHCIIVQDV